VFRWQLCPGGSGVPVAVVSKRAVASRCHPCLGGCGVQFAVVLRWLWCLTGCSVNPWWLWLEEVFKWHCFSGGCGANWWCASVTGVHLAVGSRWLWWPGGNCVQVASFSCCCEKQVAVVSGGCGVQLAVMSRWPEVSSSYGTCPGDFCDQMAVQ
jgi:hypothetical protein